MEDSRQGISVRQSLVKVPRFIVGLIVYALGLVLIMKADFGRTPWDVFSHGVSIVSHITIGMADIAISLALLVFALVKKRGVGLGTVLNTLLIGVFIDLFFALLPGNVHIGVKAVYFALGLFFVALGNYIYISTRMSPGVRDILVKYIMDTTGWSLRFVKSMVEILAAVCGALLGGQWGPGTVIFACLIGLTTNRVFSLFHFKW